MNRDKNASTIKKLRAQNAKPRKQIATTAHVTNNFTINASGNSNVYIDPSRVPTENLASIRRSEVRPSLYIALLLFFRVASLLAGLSSLIP